MRRFHMVLAAIAVMVPIVAGAAPASASTAITPSNKPTPVAGQTNGEMDQSQLITVAPDCQAYRPAASSLALLLRLAHNSSIALSTNECYRPLSGQQSAQQSWTSAGNSACAASVSTTPTGKPVGTSMHGWGKAVDWDEAPRGIGFSTPGYSFLKAQAGRVGWNHPGWAEPGGSACPEPWHWEWVGDGGTQGGTPIRADVVGLLPAPAGDGYASVTGLGLVTPRGAFASHGGADTIPLNQLIVGSAATPDGSGYWMVAADGGIFSFGSARFYGSTGGMRLNRPVVAMAPSAGGGGYWLFASDGGVFAFGDAGFAGSLGGIRLNQPVLSAAATPSGHGYWMVAADGGIFAFGDAPFLGSAGGAPPATPVVTMVATHSGGGYWIAAADGTVLPYGDASSFGNG